MLLILAVMQSQIANRQVGVSTGSGYLIQGLEPEIIDKIVLGTGDKAVTLQRRGEQFVVANKDNYPAQAKTIAELITTCLDIQTVELITNSAANHADLEVTEEKAQYVVKFLKQSDGENENTDEVLSGLIVGKRNEQGNGTYVRLINDDKVYLAANVGWLRTAALDYVDKKITEVKKDDIVKVTVTSPEGSYTIIKDPTGKAYLPEIPEGKKAKENRVDQTFTALTNLNFSDVRSEDRADKNLDFQTTYVCRLQDSTVYTLKLAQKDSKNYVKCAADFLDKTNVIKKEDVASDEAMKDKEKLLLAQEAALKFAARHKGWIYELASWQADKLTRKLSDLLEDIKKEEPQEQNEKEESQPQED